MKEQTKATPKKKLTEAQMAKRDERIRKLYAKTIKKTGERVNTICGIAAIIGLSKSRVHEIIKEGQSE